MHTLKSVKWLFFDMGSTLVDETRAYDHRIMDMIQGSSLSFAEISEKRVELAKQGFDGNTALIHHFGLKKTPWHGEDERLYDETRAVLEALSARGYHLGVLANQGPGAEERLEKWGIRGFFQVIASSAELGVAKPEPGIFHRALAMAGCVAGEAVMIGDRLDNDIIPAKHCGMRTVWLRSGLAAVQPRELGAGWADAIVDSLPQLLGLFCE